MPESPASVGVPGPGEMMIRSMIFSSRRNKTSAIDAASLRSVRGGARLVARRYDVRENGRVRVVIVDQKRRRRFGARDVVVVFVVVVAHGEGEEEGVGGGVGVASSFDELLLRLVLLLLRRGDILLFYLQRRFLWRKMGCNFIHL